jgi:hypothetical protein
MKEEPHHPRIEPELEARIVALVLGEASDFEREELERLIDQRLELTMLRKQLETVHGLLRDMTTGESTADDDDWKLSDEKRSAVLAVMDGEAKEKREKNIVQKSVEKRKPTNGHFFWNFTKIAAVLCVMGFITTSMATWSIYHSKVSIDATRMASNMADTSGNEDASGPVFIEGDFAHAISSKPKDLIAEGEAVAKRDHGVDSKSAILAIRRSLNRSATASTEAVNGLGSLVARSSGLPAQGPQRYYATESTEAVNDPESRSRGIVGKRSNVLGSLVKDGTDRLADSNGIALRPMDLKPALQSTSGKANLSFPDLGDSSGVLFGSAPAEPATAEPATQAAPTASSSMTLHEFKSPQAPNDLVVDAETAGMDVDGIVADDKSLGRGGGFGGAGGEMLARQGRKGISAGRKLEESSRRKLSESTRLNINATTGVATLGRSGGSNEIDPISERFQPAQIELQPQLAPSGTQGLQLMVTPRIVIEEESLLGLETPVKKPAAPAGLNEKMAEEEAFSTFSLHVSDVSFKLAQAALAKGEWPDAAKIRIEEFVNAFDYGDPMPSQSEKVACRLEQTIHPFLQQRNLLRVSMRTAAAGRSGDTPLRLTFLLDNSGSMERIDRQETVRRAFVLLTQQLKPIDQVTLISFARQPRLLADKVSGAQSDQLVQLIGNLPSEGGTNFEAALQLAFEKAQEQQVDHAQNRIIMLTDGAVNLGDAKPESLARMIETMRNAGLAFDAAGISAEGLNDEILEALTRKGDGRYYLLDKCEDADDGFARQIAGALRPAAKNVKVQIEFNPKRVGHYKLLGFEKHRLKKEDFRNDQVDAAEMAAAEAGVAVYQFEAKPDGEGDVGSVSVRFRDMSTGQMVENRWPIPYEADAPRPDQAAPSLRIATSAALLAAKLRGEPLGETVDLKTLSNLLAGLPDCHRNARRVQQLQQMIHQARQMSGE